MDIHDAFPLPVWFFCACVFIYLLHIYTSRQHGLFRALNINGPPPYPFVGGIPDILRKGMLQNDQDNVRKYGKCYGAFMGNLPTLVVTDTEMIKEVFIKQFHLFHFRGQAFNIAKFWRNGLNLAEGGHWKFLRATLSPSFSTGKIRNMKPVMLQCIGTMLDVVHHKLSAGSDVLDMTSLFHCLALDMTCGTILGVTINSQRDPNNKLVRHCRRMFKLNLETNPCVVLTSLLPHMKHVFNFFDVDFMDKTATSYLQKAIRPIISGRKACNDDTRGNLLALMVQAQKETAELDDQTGELSYEECKARGLTDVELTANAIAFMLGGYDTTSTTLIFLTYLLAVNPQCQQKVIDEIEHLDQQDDRDNLDEIANLPYLDAVVSETMRLYPVGTMTNRESDVDTEVCGVKIPGGLPVTVPIYVLHRMPEYWYHPNDFIPERWLPANKHEINPYAYMPFGLGPRGCIGKRMATIAIKLTVVQLIKHFQIEAIEGLQVPVELDDTFFLCPKRHMSLRVTKRNHDA